MIFVNKTLILLLLSGILQINSVLLIGKKISHIYLFPSYFYFFIRISLYFIKIFYLFIKLIILLFIIRTFFFIIKKYDKKIYFH